MLNSFYQILRENPDFSMFVYIFTPLLLLICSELVVIQFRSRIKHVCLVRVIHLLVNTVLILSFCFWFLGYSNLDLLKQCTPTLYTLLQKDHLTWWSSIIKMLREIPRHLWRGGIARWGKPTLFSLLRS